MRHGYAILNQSVNILREYWLLKMPCCIANRKRTVKKVFFFFDNKGPIMQLPVPKGRTVTGAFYKNVLKKLKAHFKRRRPKTGLRYLCLLYDNAPAHKARIVFVESQKVNVLPHPPFSPDLAPCDYFLFSKFKFHGSGKRYVKKCSWVCCISVPHGCAYSGL